MRVIASLAAIAMVSSVFLSWVAVPSGEAPTPFELFRRMQDMMQATGATWSDLLRNLDLSGDVRRLALAAFAASLGLAAVFAVLGLAGWFPRFARLLTGGLAAGLLVFGWVELSSSSAQMRAMIGPEAESDLIAALRDILLIGPYLYFGGGLVVLLAGLVPAGK